MANKPTAQATETDEEKAARLRAEREARMNKVRLRAADGIDKAVKSVKVTTARLDETEDADLITETESALDVLRGLRDKIRQNANGSGASTASTNASEKDGNETEKKDGEQAA